MYIYIYLWVNWILFHQASKNQKKQGFRLGKKIHPGTEVQPISTSNPKQKSNWLTKSDLVSKCCRDSTFQLHPQKLTCPLKMDYFTREYIFQPLEFSRDMLVFGSVYSQYENSSTEQYSRSTAEMIHLLPAPERARHSHDPRRAHGRTNPG